MKLCKSCGEEKPLGDYHKNRSMPDGLAHQCKLCKKEAQKKHRDKHSDKLNAATKAWREGNSAHVADYRKSYVSLNKDKFRSYQSKRRATYRGCLVEADAEELGKIADLYWLAKDLKAVSGEDYHVDHIVPLSKGGEHRLHNLQILHAVDNLRKGAKLL